MDWFNGITMAIAIIGAVLGILNTWFVIDQRRVRLRVRPAYAIARGGIGFSIQVTNLSAFPLTVTEVGFVLPGKKRAAITDPMFMDGKEWPRRLEARESVTAYFDPTGLPKGKIKHIGKAYAQTACGEAAYGSSPALRQLREIGTSV
ncbi:hypothetical protein [Hoeflea sp.]|uniref:hypothetical protein n=1 Tax=Hoeflea sp. TaxID=1940281 RepID=UPI003A8F0BC0